MTFSDLSHNPKAVAERATRLGRLHVTHRDATGFYLTTADREEQRDENFATAARVFTALMKHELGARAVTRGDLVTAPPPEDEWDVPTTTRA